MANKGLGDKREGLDDEKRDTGGESRGRTQGEALAQIEGLRLIDDVFMRAVLRDQVGLVQSILRTVTGIGGLELARVETQRDLMRLAGARSLALDAWGVGPDGTEYDMEVQTGVRARPRRLRYHSACMDVEALGAGEPFERLPEQWVVFVMERDPFGEGRPTYLFENVGPGGRRLGDGTRKLYANGSYRGDDEIGRLMADFCEPDPDRIRDPALADRVRYFKRTERGRHEMESMSERLMRIGREDGRREGAEANLIENARSIMEAFRLTAQQALDVLKVPEADRPRLMELL